MKRIVIRDIRTGKLFSVKAESEDAIPGLEPGDVILEVIPQNQVEGRALTPEECKDLKATPGFETVSAYQFPKLVDAQAAVHSLDVAPWAT